MNEFSELFWRQLSTTSGWEWLAVAFAIAYLLLAVNESIWCWPAAFMSTAIYSFLFFGVNLYMESMLNIYYLLMAIYGWYQWSYNTQGQAVKPVIVWPLKIHCYLIVGLSSLVLISGFLLDNYTNQDFAYIDSFTTWFAVVTTYMVAKKVVENWLYWIVIDAVSIYLYINKGLALTAVLFFCYLFIAVFGWLKWRRHLSLQMTTQHYADTEAA